MSLLWITPMVQFWGAVFGPLRPFRYPEANVAPSGPWFLMLVAFCFLPLLLPKRYYGCWERERGVRVYRALGVRMFRRVATNGDMITRWARRMDPGYRLIRDWSSAQAWLKQTRVGERHHLVLLLMGVFSGVYAARIGWYGWAAGLALGNLVFNLYPVLLQRYNRCRIERLSAISSGQRKRNA